MRSVAIPSFALLAACWLGVGAGEARAQDTGRAHFVACSERQPGRCKVTLELGEAAHLEVGPQDGLKMFDRNRKVYTAKHLRVVATKDLVRKTKTITLVTAIADGNWHVETKDRTALVKAKTSVRYFIERGEDSVDWEDPNLFAAGGAPATLATADQSGRRRPLPASGGTQLAQASDTDTAPSGATHDAPARGDARSHDSSHDNARDGSRDGRDAPTHDRERDEAGLSAMLSLRLGTPNSPTGMYGLSLEAAPITPRIPLMLGYGEYDSRAFMDPKFGSIHYFNTSAGLGLALGDPSTVQLRATTNIVRTEARYKQAKPNATKAKAKDDGSDAEASDAAPQPQEITEGVPKTRTTQYVGLVPAIGLGINVGPRSSLLIDWGRYMPLSGSYAKDGVAPLTPVKEPSRITGHNRTTTFSMGLGLHF